MRRPWLKHIGWETVVASNEHLCQGGNALHKPTSDGYEPTKALWIENCERELELAEAIEICRQCHRMAPFCFYNGNTFVAIIRDCITRAPDFSAAQIALAKSLAGHMVAGTAEPEEIVQFQQLVRDVECGPVVTPQPNSFQVGDHVQTLKGTLSGTVVRIEENGNVTWKCEQTGGKMTGTSKTLKPVKPR
jgi:hypothetical protein